MTSEEHQIITDLRDRVARIERALLEEEPDGTPPFIQRAARVVNAAESGSWGIKWSVRIFLAMGSVLLTISAIKGSFFK